MNMKSHEHRRSIALASAVTLTLLSAQSLAQQSSRSDGTLDEVVVTGSLIQGTPEDSALPVEVITFEDLQALGRPSNVDLLKTLSEVGQVAGEANRANFYPIGAATVNLRNLGARFTTVIFNGRRFPEQYSVLTGRFNNIAWIPNAAIGRVEVLKEGGAVTYGADAVGGVVNYITRKDFDGLELNADYRYIDDSDGDYTADLLWGTTFDRGNVLVAAGYQHRSELLATDREWSQRPFLENPAHWTAGGSPGSYVLQARTTPTTYTSITPNVLVPPTSIARYQGNLQMSSTGVIRDPNCTALGGFAGWSATPSPVCYFNQAQLERLVQEEDSYQVYSELNFNLTDSLSFHGEALYYRLNIPDITIGFPGGDVAAWPLIAGATPGTVTRQTVGLAQTPGFVVSGRNPAVANLLSSYGSAFTAPQIAALTSTGRVGLVQGTWRPFGAGGTPDFDVQENTTDMYRVTAGLKGSLPEFWGTSFKWDVAATYTRVEDRREAQDILIDKLQAALNGFGGPDCNGIEAGQPGSTCSWFNPFSSAIASNAYSGAANPGFVPSLANDPSLVRWLYQPISLERIYENYVLDAVVSGDTPWDLPGGPLAVAFGTQFRWSGERTDLDDLSDRDVTPCATVGVTNCAEGIRTGPFVFTRPSTVFGTTLETNRRYPVAAVFFEAHLPIWDTIDVQLAARYEKFYSDVTEVDNDVFVPAGAIKWQPLNWLALRTSFGKTFSQVNPPEDDGPIISNSAAIARFGGVGGGASGVTWTQANYDNVDVKPENGEYMNFGLLLNTGPFNASIDYFDIRVGDYSRTLTAAGVVTALVDPSTPTGADALINCSSPLLSPQDALGGLPFVQLNQACVQGATTLSAMNGGRVNYFGGVQQTNSGELKTTGIDFSASYAFDNVFGGELRPSIDFTYNLEWELDDFIVAGVPIAPGYDGIGYQNQSTGRLLIGVPEWRGTLGLNYRHGRHSLNILGRFIPSLENEDPTEFDASNDQNANIGDGAGAVTSGTTTAAATCTVPASGLTSDLGQVPVGAGSGTRGGASPGVANTVGFCPGQNTAVLSGQEVDDFVTVDLVYRLELPAQTVLSLSVYNLTDEEPSFSRGRLSYDAGFGSPLQRNFKLGLSKRF